MCSRDEEKSILTVLTRWVYQEGSRNAASANSKFSSAPVLLFPAP